MNKIKIILVNTVILLSFMLPANSFAKNFSDSTAAIKGIWQGTLKFSGLELRIVFKISEDEHGELKCLMDSPDQSAKDIVVDSVFYSGGDLKLVVNIAHGYFQGKYNPDSISLEGNWYQAGRSLPLVLKRIDKLEEANRPQEPKPPFPYKVEDVIYENQSAGIKLGGTLTMPQSGGPFPAVLLITGSGAQNRDEELFGHKPFLVIADYLTNLGIAVLRVDDRGVGESTGNFAAATTKDFATDVLAGVEYLKTRKEINPQEIGLIGHSEGGIIAPMVAIETNDVAFIVLMAGTGIPGDQLLLKQSELISKANGIPQSQIEKNNSLTKKLYEVIKAEPDSLKAAARLHKIFIDYISELDEKEKSEVGDPEKAFLNLKITLLRPWFRFFLSYNPVPTLEKVKCPVLAIDGEKDLQVPPKEDLDAIKAALEKGGNKNFEVKELPGLNHLFQTSETGSPTEYGKIEETISPIALQTMGDWILSIIKK